MKPTKWSGMITNISPHSIPPGATVDQMNIGTETAGQLTTRGGMRMIATVSGGAFDVHGYVNGGYYYAIVMTAEGGIARIKGPQYGSLPSSPVEPTLAASGKQSSTSYTQRCQSALEDI